ncbi:MAG: hypothetical protein ABRQ37_19075 [Candidatus Eremiobacterota bacterium]
MSNEEEKTVYALQNPENVRKMYKALAIVGEHLDEFKADMEEKSRDMEEKRRGDERRKQSDPAVNQGL